jgi:hypothetical protein
VLGPQPATASNITPKKKLVRAFNTAPVRPGTEQVTTTLDIYGMVRRAHPRIQHSVTDVTSLNTSVPNTVENHLSLVIVTSTNLVQRRAQAYDAAIAGHWLVTERTADAGTLFREAREQA